MGKLITKIVSAFAGLAMVIGVGFAIANNKANKVEAAAGDAASGNWTRITSAADVNTSDDFLLGWNYSGTDYFTNGTVTSKGLNTTATISSAKLVRFETATGGYYIKHTASNYVNNDSGTDMSLGEKSSIWTIDSGLYVVNTSNSNRFLGAASNSATARLKAYASSNKGSYPQVFVYKRAVEFGTLHHIKIATPATKLSYLTGETFSSAGLVLTGYDGENEATAAQQTYYSGYTTDYDGHVFVRGDVGEKTVTVTYSGKTVTYTINVAASPDFVHTYASNSVFGSTSYSTTETATHTPENGPEYITLGGYNYPSGSTMSLRNTAGMYFGNNDYYKLETVKKSISKIVIDTNQDVHDKVQMTEGQEALSEAATITPDLSNNNKTLTYNFSGNTQFFKFKSTAAQYINMTSIKVYLGDTYVGPEVDSVIASVNAGTYYVGEKLSASDFAVRVTWTAGKADTYPTSGFTWTVNGVEDGALVEGDNAVVVTYDEVSSASFNVLGTIPPAKYVIENRVSTSSSLAYSNYTKSSSVASDTLNRAITGREDTNYGSWTWESTNSTGITYKGRSAGSNNSIQLRASDNSGVVASTNAQGRFAKSLSIVWESHTPDERILEVYGKNDTYSAASELYNDTKKGTLIASLTCGDKDTNSESSLAINGYYKYIGIKSSSGAIYISSISIEWDRLTYTYDDLAIRFTGSVEQSLYERLDTESDIQGYGVLLAEYDFIKDTDTELKNWYILIDDINIKNFDNSHTVHDPAEKATPTLKDGNYVWNLFKRVSLAKATTEYVAVAYIKLANDEMVFLQQERISVKKLAQDLIAGPERDENSLGGSLNYLANL